MMVCGENGCRKQARRQAAAEKGDPHSGSAAKKSARAAVLAQWLVDTYGVAYLSSGTGEGLP